MAVLQQQQMLLFQFAHAERTLPGERVFFRQRKYERFGEKMHGIEVLIIDRLCQNGGMTDPHQPRNPLHGLTLEAIVTALAAHYGWDGLGQRINIRCFTSEPSVASSLKFLRKTPWARDKVESLYLYMLREIRRTSPPVHNFPPPRA